MCLRALLLVKKLEGLETNLCASFLVMKLQMLNTQQCLNSLLYGRASEAIICSMRHDLFMLCVWFASACFIAVIFEVVVCVRMIIVVVSLWLFRVVTIGILFARLGLTMLQLLSKPLTFWSRWLSLCRMQVSRAVFRSTSLGEKKQTWIYTVPYVSCRKCISPYRLRRDGFRRFSTVSGQVAFC